MPSNILHEYANCSFEILQSKDALEVNQLLMETLCYTDPLSVGKISSEKCACLAAHLISTAVKEGLSVIGKDKSTGKIICYVIGMELDHSKQEVLKETTGEVPFLQNLLQLWDSLDKQFRSQVHHHIAHGEIYDLFMEGIRLGVNDDEKGMHIHLRNLARNLAIERGFKGIIVQTTNTDQIYTKMGFQELGSIYLPSFCCSNESCATVTHPWEELNQSIVLLGQTF